MQVTIAFNDPEAELTWPQALPEGKAEHRGPLSLTLQDPDAANFIRDLISIAQEVSLPQDPGSSETASEAEAEEETDAVLSSPPPVVALGLSGGVLSLYALLYSAEGNRACMRSCFQVSEGTGELLIAASRLPPTVETMLAAPVGARYTLTLTLHPEGELHLSLGIRGTLCKIETSAVISFHEAGPGTVWWPHSESYGGLPPLSLPSHDSLSRACWAGASGGLTLIAGHRDLTSSPRVYQLEFSREGYRETVYAHYRNGVQEDDGGEPCIVAAHMHLRGIRRFLAEGCEFIPVGPSCFIFRNISRPAWELCLSSSHEEEAEEPEEAEDAEDGRPRILFGEREVECGVQ
jgi:hypothetical protein